MSSLKNQLDALIASAMKAKDNVRLETLKLIKHEFVKKEKDGVELTDAIEAQILNKMIAQRKDSIEQFTKGNRLDLVEGESAQIDIIKEFAPIEVSEDVLIDETKKVINELKAINGSVSMRDMKTILSAVSAKYPTVNGKLVSTVLKSEIA